MLNSVSLHQGELTTAGSDKPAVFDSSKFYQFVLVFKYFVKKLWKFRAVNTNNEILK